MAGAYSIRVRGVVQGVGFRPFVYRLAQANGLTGWVRNGEAGVEIYLEGNDGSLQAFARGLKAQSPPASQIAAIDVQAAEALGLQGFVIRESEDGRRPTVRISPDMPVCKDCLDELFNRSDPRYHYPYINCTNCGPRYSVILGLPYDRAKTTMKAWPLDQYCEKEYSDPGNRRFHAQPVACPVCGPRYYLRLDGGIQCDPSEVIRKSVELLRCGKILAIKGLGGYHLGCDAQNQAAVRALRERKYRKEKPFAVMVKDLAVAHRIMTLSSDAVALLTCVARPIVLAPANTQLTEIAPDNHELGVMLPYTPLQHLLFDAGAPEMLVMTSANRSSEPIAHEDNDAFERLSGIADAFLVGERPIARRVDDSVVRAGVCGPMILRRSRGYAPSAVATLPTESPILALGADLKNAVTLVVDGQAFVSQHLGDLEHFQVFRAFQETICDLVSMYEVDWKDLLVVHDAHPQYLSAMHAQTLPAAENLPIQHHRAHVASVLAERGQWEKRVLGISLDGTGYGDDGTIWGGEFFVGSVREGFERVAHLRPAALPGGDAAAQFPAQAAAGFLAQVDGLPDLSKAPFNFPERYFHAIALVSKHVRSFATTSVGRLFDTVAALLGFTREITFEGQAAMWVEHLARTAPPQEPYPFPFHNAELDFRPLLHAVANDRQHGRKIEEIARSFQQAIAAGLADAARSLLSAWNIDTVVLSGGVFQNELLMEDLKATVRDQPLQIWTNQAVPPNDGGISLGQAALAALSVGAGVPARAQRLNEVR